MTARTKRFSVIIVASFFGIVIGFATSVFLLKPDVPSKWFTLVQPVDDISVPKGNSVNVVGRVSVSYSTSVIIDSDIPSLNVESLSGKAKLLPSVYSTDGRCPIGYIISISTQPLDKSKLPDKYRKEKVITVKAGPLTVLPLDEATYEVYFIFQLLDRDGFELLTVNSSKHNIKSGETTNIQGQTKPLVRSTVAALTDRITFHMVVEECLSATAE